MITRIKICGITNPDAALAIAHAGADALGLVFYPPSPRHITLAAAQQIAAATPPFVSLIGLFVNPSQEQILAAPSAVPLDMLQFHGNESADFCQAFARPYLKAVQMKPGVDLLEYAARYPSARAILCDAFSAAAPGGTGETFDWQRIPTHRSFPLVLSGGLTPENVGTGIRSIRPAAVDVSSGVERTKGMKDLDRVVAFVQAVRAADSASLA